MVAFKELSEEEAKGTVAAVYRELRNAYAAPYVSSLHRHLATYPRLLEWLWAVLSPVFRSGGPQHLAWSLAEDTALPRLPALTREDLGRRGIDAGGLKALRNVCSTFTRVSPVNLIFAGCVGTLLGARSESGETGTETIVCNPQPLPTALLPSPPLVDVDALTGSARAAMRVFETDLAGQTFVPGLYRMLAHWPDFLILTSERLAPLRNNPETLAKFECIARQIVAAHRVVLDLAPVPTGPPPVGPDERQRIFEAIATYRMTSPEMMGFGALLLDALPTDGEPGEVR